MDYCYCIVDGNDNCFDEEGIYFCCSGQKNYDVNFGVVEGLETDCFGHCWKSGLTEDGRVVVRVHW